MSTLAISHPCRPALMLVPAIAFWLRVPKVPVVSTAPASLLICEAKKLLTGRFGPDKAARDPAFGPNGIVSPGRLASPSVALSNSRPESAPDGGAQKPVTVTGVDVVAFVSSAPTNSARLRAGRAGFSYATASVQPALFFVFSASPCVAGTPPVV